MHCVLVFVNLMKNTKPSGFGRNHSKIKLFWFYHLINIVNKHFSLCITQNCNITSRVAHFPLDPIRSYQALKKDFFTKTRTNRP